MKIGLRKPFFAADGGGDGGADGTANPETNGQVIDANGVDDNVEGLKSKNSELLGKLKANALKLKKFEDAIETEKKNKLLEEGKFKELNEANEKTINTLKDKLKKKEMKLIAKDMNDPSEVILFQNDFEFDEDGNITNAEEVLANAKEKKPHLFKSDSEIIPGTFKRKPVGYTPPKGKFTKQDIRAMSDKEYEENREAILAQIEQ